MINLTLTLLAGVMQVSPTLCQVDLLHPNGQIDTFDVKCEYIIDGNILPIS